MARSLRQSFIQEAWTASSAFSRTPVTDGHSLLYSILRFVHSIVGVVVATITSTRRCALITVYYSIESYAVTMS